MRRPPAPTTPTKFAATGLRNRDSRGGERVARADFAFDPAGRICHAGLPTTKGGRGRGCRFRTGPRLPRKARTGASIGSWACSSREARPPCSRASWRRAARIEMATIRRVVLYPSGPVEEEVRMADLMKAWPSWSPSPLCEGCTANFREAPSAAAATRTIR